MWRKTYALRSQRLVPQKVNEVKQEIPFGIIYSSQLFLQI